MLKLNLDQLYNIEQVYPPREQVFRAIDLCPIKNTKVVILGQDPYHGYGQANGLAFSVNKTVPIPPSLRNIYKELESDLGIKSNHGDLSSWAKQGVLLLNSILTVEKGRPLSHAGMGWEDFTTDILKAFKSKQVKPVVFILWGKKAQEYKQYIGGEGYMIIESPHPSPFSADKGFFGSKPFSRANSFLLNNGAVPVDWSIK